MGGRVGLLDGSTGVQLCRASMAETTFANLVCAISLTGVKCAELDTVTYADRDKCPTADVLHTSKCHNWPPHAHLAVQQ